MKKHPSPLGFLLLLFFSLLIFASSPAISSLPVDPAGNPETGDTYTITVNTWVYLEGALVNLTNYETYILPMRTHLNDARLMPGQAYQHPLEGVIYTPAGQPYRGGPWNYRGSEGNNFDSGGNPSPGTANYPSTAVDWVLVSLRATDDGPALCRKAGLLHDDGHIEFVDGDFSCPGLEGYTAFYIVIEHRNHMIIMSPEAVEVVNNTLTFDFRANQSYINDPYGFGASGQKELPGYPGTFVMFSGNGCQALYANSYCDMNYDDLCYWSTHNSAVGTYCCGDYNGNGDCNFNDRFSWEPNNGVFTTVP